MMETTPKAAANGQRGLNHIAVEVQGDLGHANTDGYQAARTSDTACCLKSQAGTNRIYSRGVDLDAPRRLKADLRLHVAPHL